MAMMNDDKAKTERFQKIKDGLLKATPRGWYYDKDQKVILGPEYPICNMLDSPRCDADGELIEDMYDDLHWCLDEIQELSLRLQKFQQLADLIKVVIDRPQDYDLSRDGEKFLITREPRTGRRGDRFTPAEGSTSNRHGPKPPK
jgi:hypothetical protein